MYFLLGYLVDDFITTSKKRNILIIIGIISLILSFILGYYECLYSGNKNFIWYDYYAVNIMLYSIGMFAFFKRDYKFSEKKRTCFAKIANLSFGIYLVHDFFKILVNEKYSTLALNIPKLAGVFIVTGIVFLLSLLASWGLKKIPKLNRYIL